MQASQSRSFSRGQREALLRLAGGRCQHCGIPITTNSMHADHIVPWSVGGVTEIANGQALCANCNLIKGDAMKIPGLRDQKGRIIEPREWQKAAFTKIVSTIQDASAKDSFLLNVCPGGGKTKLGVMVAKYCLGQDIIDKVIIVAPRAKIRGQWTDEMTVNAIMTRDDLTGRMANDRKDNLPSRGLSVTYQILSSDAVAGYIEGICNKYRSLVIMDEIHWGGELDGAGNTWGEKLVRATKRARFCLALSGTPFREDHYRIPFLEYQDGVGAADYEYSYKQALLDGVVTPIYFRDRTGAITFKRLDPETREVESEEVLDFADGEYFTPMGELDSARMNRRLTAALHPTSGFWRDVMRDAIARLDWIRANRHRNAGGIVFAVDQNHARSIASFISKETGCNPYVIISSESSDIDAFTDSNDPWVVSVRMISEGVDIERLRVCAFLTNITTRKNFMQSVSRCVRLDYAQGSDCWQQEAYVFMPADPRFLQFAVEFQDAVTDLEVEPPGTGPDGGNGERKDYEVDESDTDEGGMIFGGEYFTAEELEESLKVFEEKVTDRSEREKIAAALSRDQLSILVSRIMADERRAV